MALQMPERHPLAPKPGEEIPSHLNMCFGCGVDHPTGLHMKSIAGEGLTATCDAHTANQQVKSHRAMQ